MQGLTVRPAGQSAAPRCCEHSGAEGTRGATPAPDSEGAWRGASARPRTVHRQAEADGGVTLEQVQAAAERAGGVRKGDIVFGMMGPTRYFSTAGLQWLVDQGIKLMGVDSEGVELAHDNTHANVNHLLLFRQGIPLIENLTNLDQVSQPRVQVYALVVPVRRLDAFPLRVIAVEN